MEDIERIKERLENIQSVEPIITSLRTIAAGGWRTALRHQESATSFADNLAEVLAVLLPHVSEEALARARISRDNRPPRRALMLVMASERGLCGAFNDTVLEGAERLIAQQQLQSDEVLVATLGKRAETHFLRQGRDLYMSYPLPITRVPSLGLVRELGEALVDSLMAGEFDAIFAVYSPYKAATTAEPISQRWLPIDASMLPSRYEGWTEPIIETEVGVLFERALEEWTFARLYQFVIESASSEQSARFRAMDAASSNLSRIIEELTLTYHTARQHAITMEMLDLVAGSGILRGPASRRGH
ncbi:MAG: F0F1 ATP synthase subunit gamma [Anaerolineae bacterium]|jgi:F-type H+-transporting ATPase subunit gamma